jgi:hypothetical protein
MRDLCLQAFRNNPLIRETALQVATGFGMTGPVDAADGFEQLARDSFVLVDEPEELLIDPVLMFEKVRTGFPVYGDCDDVSMFVACLTYSIGLPTRFKAVLQSNDGSYLHVFTEYMIAGRWIPIDATIAGIPVYPRGDFITVEL